jgi:uncharacterized Zn-finger protein
MQEEHEQTEVSIECDVCGKAYGGPGVFLAVWRCGSELVCAGCVSRRESVSSARRGCRATETARGVETR